MGSGRFFRTLACVAFLSCLAAGPVEKPSAAELDGDWAKMRPCRPRGYVCLRAPSPIKVDGLPDDAWSAAPWTDDFADIEGSARPKPRFRTHAKLLWDDDYLYVFAELEEPHVWGTITKKNEVIFFDNDFEMFIDPDGDNHNYYEFEMNALNTIWELTLVKPYRDGGPVRNATNIEGLKSAVHVNGTLNNPSDTDKSWCVEIAIPFKGLASYAGRQPCPPTNGEQWRMDFSRVEWLVDIIDGKYRKIPKEMRPEDNWIWSPPGVVDMHRPERWGYVQFSNSFDTLAFKPDPTAGARDVLMTLYHRQRNYKARFGKYAGTLDELQMADESQSHNLTLTTTGDGYTAAASTPKSEGFQRTFHVREDSKIWEE